jgi:hypothetical protein
MCKVLPLFNEECLAVVSITLHIPRRRDDIQAGKQAVYDRDLPGRSHRTNGIRASQRAR